MNAHAGARAGTGRQACVRARAGARRAARVQGRWVAYGYLWLCKRPFRTPAWNVRLGSNFQIALEKGLTRVERGCRVGTSNQRTASGTEVNTDNRDAHN